jgi:phosphoglycerate dehydrogenase-like enzyme
MNIYYISPVPVLLPRHEEVLKKLGTLKLIKAEKLSEEEVARLVKDADIIALARPAIAACTDNFFSRLPQLKLLTTVSTSHDWIDVEAAKKRAITVTNCKGANARSVAESTWSLILALAKRTVEYAQNAKNKGAYKFKDYVGVELAGKTLGVIGLGDIGSETAKIGLAFGMRVLGFNRSKKDIVGVQSVDLEALLKESDVISIHVPLTDQTKHFIDKVKIEKMKDKVILVNTSDEAVVEKEAVIAAIEQKKIYGYAVETPLMTPLSPLDPYLTHSNIIAYPHNGFNTKEANIHVKDTWVQNIVQFVAGKPQNVV